MECPWCHEEVEIRGGRCPECKQPLYEVTDRDFDEVATQDNSIPYNDDDFDVVELIINRFRCSKCRCETCIAKEIAVTGAGLSKILDIQHNHYLNVSCSNCGSVETFDMEVLKDKKAGAIGTILDTIFG